MEIYVAKTAGFCFGVNNAIKMVSDLLDNTQETIYTLGPIIHNDQVVERLCNQGVRVIESSSDTKEPGNIVIRAHGVSPQVYDEIKDKGFKIFDATCPYVKKIHRLVREKWIEGCQVIIIGDNTHPEVQGINGWCGNTAIILNSIVEAQKLSVGSEKVCVVAQTTITKEKWNEINEILDNKFVNIFKFDTICGATSQRQTEAEKIAGRVDLMLVLGGKKSSNTQKLYDICRKSCPNTYKIETSGDIPPVDIEKIKKVGITAGASTPDWVIKEVIKKMSELNKQDVELSFKEAFESSLVTLKSGEIAKGKIIGFNNSEVFVDMGYKSDGIIPMEEFTEDPDFNPDTSLKAGEEIVVYIVRVNDGEGNVLLSKKKVDSMKSWEKIEEAYDNKTTLKAKVIDVTNGGVIALSGGIRIFVPASQISDRYVKDLNEFNKQNISVRIIEYNRQKRKLVGSQRVILEEERSKLEGALWDNIEIGKKYSGTVKSVTDFGVFVDIGGVDGLIHISELSWSKVKHPSEVLKIGDEVEVTIQEFDREKKRVSLGFRKQEDNPWHNAAEKYKVGEIVKGEVVRLVPFGAFVELEPGVDALVHISQISNVRITKPSDVLEIGKVIEAKITELNLETRKIGLSIKEVNPIDPPNSKKEEQEAKSTEGEAPSEHKEEMNNTIGDLISDVKEENSTEE